MTRRKVRTRTSPRPRIQRETPPPDLSAFAGDYLTTAMAARWIGMAPQTMRVRRMGGDSCRYSKIGGRVYYRKSDLEAWLAAHRFTSTSDEAARRAGGGR